MITSNEVSKNKLFVRYVAVKQNRKFRAEQSLANLANSAESYWGPLSEHSTSGIPCLANTDLRAGIIPDEASGTK